MIPGIDPFGGGRSSRWSVTNSLDVSLPLVIH